MKTMLLLSAVCILGICPMFAASPDTTFTFNISGTLGPNENGGPDCLGVNGDTFTGSATFSSLAKPVATTASTATYNLKAGTVTATIGSFPTFTNTTTWKAIFNISLHALTLKGAGPSGSSITGYFRGPVGMYTTAAKTHPQQIECSGTPCTSPVSNTTPSYVTYSDASLSCAATKLGFTGTYSN